MNLTAQQLHFFDTFGFLQFPGLLAQEADAITAAFEEVWAAHGGGHDGRPHDHKQRSALVPFLDQHEYLCGLLDDPRIEGIGSALLGADFNYTGSDGNYYVGDTRWHSDGYRAKKYMSLKMALYLDPVTRDTGCLRVVPGSHRFGDAFAEALEEVSRRTREESTVEDWWGVPGSGVPAFPLESEPGDLVVFNHCLKHSSWGGGTRRRMFTINMQQRHAEEDLDALREDIAASARFWVERAYGEVMLRTAGPARMRHLEQRLANDGHLAALSRKARAEMSEPSRG